jgi:hypothetical protein
MSVFISYSSVDKRVARRILAQLKKLGIESFLDLVDMVPGDDVVKRITDGLERCSVLLLVVSETSLRSPWVNFEVGYATGLQKRVVPFITQTSLELPGYLMRLAHMTKMTDLKEHLSAHPDGLVVSERSDDAAALQSQTQAYQLSLKATSDSFSFLAAKRNVLAPISIERHLGIPVREFLNWAATAHWVLIRHHTEDSSVAWTNADKEAFIYHSFVAMAWGFLLDRFVDTRALEPEDWPILANEEQLERRWYESVLTNDAWLHEWSEEYTRDLVDAQWLEIGPPSFITALPSNDLKTKVMSYGLKVAILLGMIARRFLRLGAPVLSTSPGE